jgi:hypothetical protein
MKRIIAAVATVAALGTGCADRGAHALGPAPANDPGPSPSSEPAPSVSTGNDAITVVTPAPGDGVSSPVTISGDADVFEATVSIEILDAHGETLASTFTTATCGTGCRGDYSTDVPFEASSTQEGVIRVFEVSAMDGSPINVVEIPVTLTA